MQPSQSRAIPQSPVVDVNLALRQHARSDGGLHPFIRTRQLFFRKICFADSPFAAPPVDLRQNARQRWSKAQVDVDLRAAAHRQPIAHANGSVSSRTGVDQIVDQSSFHRPGNDERALLNQHYSFAPASQFMRQNRSRRAASHDQIVDRRVYPRDLPPFGVVAEMRRGQHRSIAFDPIGRRIEVYLDSGQLLLNSAVSFDNIEIAHVRRQPARFVIRTSREQQHRPLALRWRHIRERR